MMERIQHFIRIQTIEKQVIELLIAGDVKKAMDTLTCYLTVRVSNYLPDRQELLNLILENEETSSKLAKLMLIKTERELSATIKKLSPEIEKLKNIITICNTEEVKQALISLES